MNKRRIADDLDKAADYMTRHGQARGKFVTIGGRVCAVGALRKASGCGRANQAWKHMDKRSATLFGGIGDPNVPVGLTGVNDAKLTDIPSWFHKEAARLRGKPSRRGVGRQGQKDARAAQAKADRQAKAAAAADARQHPCATPASSSGSRMPVAPVLGLAAVVAVAYGVFHFATLMLAALLHYLLIIAEAGGLTAAVIGLGAGVYLVWTKPDWGYVRTWRAQRAALTARQAEFVEAVEEREQLFALPAPEVRSPISVDDVLKKDWAQPTREFRPEPRRPRQ